MGHSQRSDIIRVKLTRVGARVRLGDIDNDEVGAHEADPVIPLDMHGHSANTCGENAGAMFPYEDNGTKVGDLEEVEHEFL